MILGRSMGDVHGGQHITGNEHASALKQECRSVGHQPAQATLNSFRSSVQIMLPKQSNYY